MLEVELTTEIETEIDDNFGIKFNIKDIIDEMTDEQKIKLLGYIFVGLNGSDKSDVTSSMFYTMDEGCQNDTLDTIIASYLSDKQFHVLTNYFRTNGK